MAPTAQHATDRIMSAAFTVFSKQPVAGCSMASIAEAAGMSRPALYQYFDDKNDIYRAMLQDLLERSAETAIAALEDQDSVRAALLGFIEGSWADDHLWRLSRQQGPDLVAAKAGFARPVVEAHYGRLIAALRVYLEPHAASDEQLAGWIDMVRYAPLGFGYDQPTRATFRQRLKALATALADSADVGLRQQAST